MNKLTLLKKQLLPRDNSGFTLLELLVVVAIVAILSAIAAPGWLGFVTQRRVNVANEEVYRTLQEAQREAKRKKLSYSVSIRVIPNPSNPQLLVPQIAMHPDSIRVADLTTNAWKNIGSSSNIKPEQILLYTNLQPNPVPPSPAQGASTKNQLKPDIQPNTFPQPISPPNGANSGPVTITFDQQGILAPVTSPQLTLGVAPNIIEKGLIIGVGVPRQAPTTPNSQASDSNKRCVIVKTLLGTMETNEGATCNPWV